MDKRNQIIDPTTIECIVLIVLTDSERAILESEDLREQIDSIAKDLHVSWHVEQNANNVQVAISKLLGPISTSKDEHELEITATNFMTAVNKLTLPAFEKEKKEGDWEGEGCKDDELKFVNYVLNNIEEARGAMILQRGIPLVLLAMTEKGTMIGHYCLKRMCEAYIEKYDHK